MTKEDVWRKTMINYDFSAVEFEEVFYAGWDAAIASTTPFLPDPIPYQEIISAFNKIFSERPKPITLTASYRKYIHARWQEGMRVEDFEAVCRIKKSQWDKDPKMRGFLRPETLFSNKMMTYRNEEEQGSRQKLEDWQ